MKKKILISVGIFILILVIAVLYLSNRNRTLSPPGYSEVESNGLKVVVDYSRPSVRDRLIFGTEEDGALQPHGKYWRLGANEPTFIEVNSDFKLDDKPLAGGKYAMYAFPNEKGFEIRLSSNLRFWGVTEPDFENDVLSIQSDSSIPVSSVEQFTIDTQAKGDEIAVIFSWSDRVWEFMISKQ